MLVPDCNVKNRSPTLLTYSKLSPLSVTNIKIAYTSFRIKYFFLYFVTNKFDLNGKQMFPITFENVQKMFEKCSNFRNASFEVTNFLHTKELFI